jgi:hypothetical protein
MSKELKLQSQRKHPEKPAVVKDYLGWWAQVRAPHGHINKLYRSHHEALAKALRFAAGDYEEEAA